MEVTETLECYDPQTNMWEYKRPMKVKRFLFAAVVGRDGKIYVFGGRDSLGPAGSSKTYDTTDVYDPKTDSWSIRSPMPLPREAHAGVLAIDGRIYIMGGESGWKKPPVKDVFIYDPAIDKWQKGPKMNLPRSTLAAVATPDGKIYAIGGTDVGAYKKRYTLNFFLPKKIEFYTGKVQDTVEVLDISD